MSPTRPIAPPEPPPADPSGKVRDAARQFEALLLGQILRAAREGGGLTGERDAASDCAMDFAEQQLAAVMANNGGLGLASLVVRGLEERR